MALVRRDILLSIVVGLCFTALVAVPVFENIAVRPGLLLARPLWPQGIDTRPGPGSAVAFLIVVYAGSWATWSVLTLAFWRFLRMWNGGPTRKV